jgi:hypothetical protein
MHDNAAAPTPADPARQPKLLERMRIHLRTRHYSIRMEEAYIDWARRFILFHGKPAPAGHGRGGGGGVFAPSGGGQAGVGIHAEPGQGGDSVSV